MATLVLKQLYMPPITYIYICRLVRSSPVIQRLPSSVPTKPQMITSLERLKERCSSHIHCCLPSSTFLVIPCSKERGIYCFTHVCLSVCNKFLSHSSQQPINRRCLNFNTLFVKVCHMVGCIFFYQSDVSFNLVKWCLCLYLAEIFQQIFVKDFSSNIHCRWLKF